MAPAADIDTDVAPASYDPALGAAFFDVDRTLLSGASALRMVRPFRKQGMVSRRQMINGAIAQVAYSARGADDASIERSYLAVEDLMSGWDVAHMRRVIEQELERRLRPTVFREALERIELHHRQGQAAYAVSATMRELIDPLSAMLNLDGAIATELEQRDGKLTGKVASPCHGHPKADRVREFAAAHGIDLARSSAYSDSISDEPLLRLVGRPYAVNPDRELRRLAEEEGWGVLFFRTRIKAPLHRRRSTQGAAVAALAAVAFGRRYRRRRARR